MIFRWQKNFFYLKKKTNFKDRTSQNLTGTSNIYVWTDEEKIKARKKIILDENKAYWIDVYNHAVAMAKLKDFSKL